MALTETYVDPNIAANSGTGTVGDPYGDIQYALDTMTRDGTNGDRLNIKAGTDEILAAALTLVTYGTPSEAAPLFFQGYTSAAGDGGIGGISGNGTYGVLTTAYDRVSFVDMHLHNSGSAIILDIGDDGVIQNCEVDNSTGTGIDVERDALVIDCYVHNVGGAGISLWLGSTACFNYIENGTNDCVNGIITTNITNVIYGNIIDVDGASNGIDSGQDSNKIFNNTIYSNAGTGTGITIGNNTNQMVIINNIIEGFSGVGGVGIATSGVDIHLVGNNAFYNNTTDKSITGRISIDLTGNDQALGASPFTDAANDDFTVDTTVKALAYPTANLPNLSIRTHTDIGALQREEAGGGGTTGKQGLHPIESGSA